MAYRPPHVKPFQYAWVPPGDKSIAHRAVLLAASIDGRSRLRGVPTSADLRRTIAAVGELGLRVDRSGEELLVSPVSGGGLTEPDKVIHCGDSGTTMRLLSGLLAPRDWMSVLTGGASLRKRPMDRVIEPLRRMGASIFGRERDRFAPIVVLGRRLRSIDYRLPVASAQVKSSILLAGLGAGVEVVVREDRPSRDHLEIMLEAQGAEITRERGIVRYTPGNELEPVDIVVPGDPSSAAFFIVLTLLVPNAAMRVEDVLLNPTRSGYIDVLRRMGADIRVEKKGKWNGEEVGDIVVKSSNLVSTGILEEEVPSIVDEVPVLSMAAVRATGETDFPHMDELRVKESDRIRSVTKNLRAIGVEVEERTNGFTIVGTRRRLKGIARSFHDHRIAMAFTVLGASPDVDLIVTGERCVGKSFPSFFGEIESIAGAGGT